MPTQATRPGDVPRRGAHPVTVFLAKLKNFLPPDVSLSTIVTLRNQTDFLGSSSAQGRAIGSLRKAAGLYGAGTTFTRIIHNEDAFVDFWSLVTELEKVSGPSQHLTLLFEDGLERNVERIEEFTNVSFSAVAGDSEPPKIENPRRIDQGTWNAGMVERGNRSVWELRNSPIFSVRRLLPSTLRVWAHPLTQRLGRMLERTVRSSSRWESGVVTVSDEDRLRMREYCAPSNKLLAQHLKRDLSALGY